MNNLQLQKDSSFNRSFERETGSNFYFFGHPNKLAQENSLSRMNSLNKNGSINFPFTPYKKDWNNRPINIFVEMADDGNNDKNDDFLNLNILQRDPSSVRPMMFKDKSCNSSYSLNVNIGNDFLHNPTPLKPKLEEKNSINGLQGQMNFKSYHDILSLAKDEQMEDGDSAKANQNMFPKAFPQFNRQHSGFNEVNAFNVYGANEVCSFGKNDNTKGLVLNKNSSESSDDLPPPTLQPLIKKEAKGKSEQSSEDEKNAPRQEGKGEFMDYADKWVKDQEKAYDQANYNWNNEVESLLEDTEEENQQTHPQPAKFKASKDASASNVNIRRHRKKSKKQLEILESYFDIDVEWSLELVEQLANELQLEKDQVYKWNWDKRKRMRKKAEREGRALPGGKKNKRQRVK